MKLTFTLLLVFLGFNTLYAKNYYTSTDGNIVQGINWVGNTRPDYSKYSGPVDSLLLIMT